MTGQQEPGQDSGQAPDQCPDPRPDQRLAQRFADLAAAAAATAAAVVPFPGGGCTAERHRRIFEAGKEDLSLAKLLEAHWDALAILQEAGLHAAPAGRYAVWASELPGRPLMLHDGKLSGTKEFCSGAGMVEFALVTAGKDLLEIDLNAAPGSLAIDLSIWKTEAFRSTCTGTVTFSEYPVSRVVGENDWYVQRTGFWQGACGPAAAWAGGAAGLVDYALTTRRDDGHTTAHLAAMQANLWAARMLLAAAGDEFDRSPGANAAVRALQVRHLVEQLCTDILRRFARALGPAPLIKNAEISRRFAELDLFLRQCHGERDLETLGRLTRASDG